MKSISVFRSVIVLAGLFFFQAAFASKSECLFFYLEGSKETWSTEFAKYTKERPGELSILNLDNFIGNKLSGYVTKRAHVFEVLGQEGVDSVLQSRTRVFNVKAKAAQEALEEYRSQKTSRGFTLFPWKKNSPGDFEVLRVCKSGVEACSIELKGAIVQTTDTLKLAESIVEKNRLLKTEINNLLIGLEASSDYVHFVRIAEAHLRQLDADHQVIALLMETEKNKMVTALIELRQTFPKLNEDLEIALSNLDAIKNSIGSSTKDSSSSRSGANAKVLRELPPSQRLSYLEQQLAKNKNRFFPVGNKEIFLVDETLALLELVGPPIRTTKYLSLLKMRVNSNDDYLVDSTPYFSLLLLRLTKPDHNLDKNRAILALARKQLTIHFENNLGVAYYYTTEIGTAKALEKWHKEVEEVLEKFH